MPEAPRSLNKNKLKLPRPVIIGALAGIALLAAGAKPTEDTEKIYHPSNVIERVTDHYGYQDVLSELEVKGKDPYHDSIFPRPYTHIAESVAGVYPVMPSPITRKAHEVRTEPEPFNGQIDLVTGEAIRDK